MPGDPLLQERHPAALHGPGDHGDRRVYTVLGDGELQEGSVWEAALLAGHRGLPGLVAAVDRNGLQITGRTEETVGLEPLDAKFEAFGWQARTVDGHDLPALREALRPSPDGPVVVIAKTVKGRGVPFLEQRVAGHYAKLKPALVQRALAAIGRSPARIRGPPTARSCWSWPPPTPG